MQRLDTERDLRQAVDRLAMVEPRFAGIMAQHGLPSLRHAEPGLRSLLRIVTDQLISLRAGEAIWSRLEARLGGFSPAEVLAASEEELRGLGLSGAKARTFRAAAQAFGEGGLAAQGSLEEAELQLLLLEIPGIGAWTASIYLLMSHRAADAWPAADLALQVAAQDLLGLPARPSPRAMVVLAEGWRPYRSTAALLLWRHYRALRGMGTG